jgi:hypothetical protein
MRARFLLVACFPPLLMQITRQMWSLERDGRWDVEDGDEG